MVFEPIGVSIKKLFALTVGAPPGAAEYLNCGMTVPDASIRIMPLSFMTMFSVVEVDVVATTVAVATAATSCWLAVVEIGAPVVVVLSIEYRIDENVAVPPNKTDVSCEVLPAALVM